MYESTGDPVPAIQKVPASTYLEVELYEQLVELAAQNDRSLAAEIRRAVRDYLAAQAA